MSKAIPIPTKPLPFFPRQTHRITQLPTELRSFVEYVPVARSFTDSVESSCTRTPFTVPDKLTNTRWYEDDSSETCVRCAKPFSSLWRRRHHCRVCGQLVCSACALTTKVSWVHQVGPTQILETNLDTWKEGASHLICRECRPHIQWLDRVYKLVKMWAIWMANQAPFPVFRMICALTLVSKQFYAVGTQLKKLLVSAQYIYGNPWNLTPHAPRTHRTQITKCLLQASAWSLSNHEYYTYALEYYLHPHQLRQPCRLTRPLPPSSGCTSLQRPCKSVICRNHHLFSTPESAITSLFFQYEYSHLSLELAICLTPTLLWKYSHDSNYRPIFEQMIEELKEPYIHQLFVWLHAFPFGATFVNQVKSMIPTPMWSQLSEDWEFFHRLCEIARTCKNNTQDPGFGALADEITRRPRRIVGYPEWILVHMDTTSSSFCQAQSSSKPFILPCKMFNKTTNTYSTRSLLIKHQQSLGSDGFVHLWIMYMKSLISTSELITTYPSIPIGPYAGILMMVPESTTLSGLRSSLQNCLYNHAENQHVNRNHINTQFANSVAFFAVLTCFIGLRDRIGSNMMIQPANHVLFHIDFEYMFNKQPPLKETIRSAGTRLEKLNHMFTNSSSSHKSSYSSCFMERSMNDDLIVVKPFLPECVLTMLGGPHSHIYTSVFIPFFNQYFQLMWSQRHALYFASQFLVFFPSTTQAPQLTLKEHATFFAKMANVVLQGSNTYGEFACKVVMQTNHKKPWTERFLSNVSLWTRGSKS